MAATNAASKKRKGSQYHNSRFRIKKKNEIAERDGLDCIWCDEPVELPIRGKASTDVSRMATIEHYFAILLGCGANEDMWFLAHKGCNR